MRRFALPHEHVNPLATSLLLLLLGAAVLISWRGKVADHAPRFDAILSFLATFIGVLLALFLTSRHEESQTRTNLCHVIAAARSETEANLKVVRSAQPKNEEISDRERLILQHPAAALSTLVKMPTFLERASPATLSELLQLSTVLDWSITYRNEPSVSATPPGGPKIVTADRKTVAEGLVRAANLLDDAERQVCQ